jgi:hypothetical protein
MCVAPRSAPGGVRERAAPPGQTGGRMYGEAVLVDHDGDWLPGSVLWRYRDHGRERALVRYETSSGLVIRRLFWCDELRRSPGRVMQIELRQVGEDEPVTRHADS